jgi:sigma-B regulation protein RsbU (phosphoserine phosphatase)
VTSGPSATPSADETVLRALLEAATQATAAAAGWLVAPDDDRLHVLAATGEGTEELVGRSVGTESGTAGYVVASGQPLALASSAGDPRLAEGVAMLLGRAPQAVLSVPCSTADAVLGALEVVDKAGGGRFTFDDVELVTLLAGIAAAALTTSAPALIAPRPTELAGDLQRLAETDAVRYAAVATAVNALLANG